jgi:hypothetical protein
VARVQAEDLLQLDSSDEAGRDLQLQSLSFQIEETSDIALECYKSPSLSLSDCLGEIEACNAHILVADGTTTQLGRPGLN